MYQCCDLSNLEKIMIKYPGLVMTKSTSSYTVLSGPVKINNIWMNINLVCPNFPNILNFKLQVQQSFNIKTYTSAKLNMSSDMLVENFLENIPTFLENIGTPIETFPNFSDNVQSNICADLMNLFAPMEYQMLLNNNCTLVRFTKFSQNEQHFVEVELPSLKLLDHSLPSCVDWKEMLGKATSLRMLLQQYRSFLDDLRPFYEHFTNIDELCHVVQPLLPNSKTNWRLFVLKERVFLKVQFNDPFSPLSSMSVHIVGPTSEVTELRRIYSEGVRDWDGELDVHKNLLRIFDLCYFPMPPGEYSEKCLQYCNICYSYKLEQGEIPIVSCDNNRCSLIFHAACLKEWFNTLADGKTFLDVALGECPFCKAKLSTSFQAILE